MYARTRVIPTRGVTLFVYRERLTTINNQNTGKYSKFSISHKISKIILLYYFAKNVS